jgi:cytochrome c556
VRHEACVVAQVGELRATLDRALAAPPMQCAGLGNTLKQVNEACKACHQDYPS